MAESFHKANKNRLGEWVVYNLLLVPGLKRAFGGLYAYVDPAALRLRGRAPYPIIFCLTHSGWFDGHVAAVLNKRIFRHDAYLMMEEAQLARYFFFTWAGVFGIDRHNASKALASIEYITGMLAEKENRTLWMFPQGMMRHPDERPFKLYGGVANIARRVGTSEERTPVAIVPVAIRYDFIMEQAPDAFVRIGPPLLFDPEMTSKELTSRLTEALESEADQLRTDVSAYNTRPYRRVLSGRGSVNKTWDGVLKLAGRVRSLVS